jgi:uncharacterized protein YcbK (DUF882 family)
MRIVGAAVLTLVTVFPVFRPSNAAAPTTSTAHNDAVALAGWIAVEHTALRRSMAVLDKQLVETTLYDINGKATLVIDLPVDGKVDEATGAALERFFHCRRTGRHKPLTPGVLAILADISSRYPGRVIEIISGYRSPPYGAPRSKHFKGNAIDLRVRGVKLAKVRDEIWSSHTGIGVGWYPNQRFIHVDSRPNEPDMAWTAKHEGARYRYHPWWSEKARMRAAKAPTIQ